MGNNRSDPAGLDALTARQREVAGLIADGLTRAEIAARLAISVHTAHQHERHVFRKLGCHRRTEVATLVTQARLTEQPPE